MVALGLTLVASAAEATVIGTSTDVFQPDRSEISFTGLSLGTVDPIYSAPPGHPDAPTVSFGSYFTGQSLGTAASCGGDYCLDGSPLSDLSLVDASLNALTFVTTEIQAPDNPVLSGYPTPLRPISILFSQDQAGVGVSVGPALASGAERLTAFDRNGDILASILNDTVGYSFLTLASDDASAAIAGVQITSTGATTGGFALDTVLFGGPSQVAVPAPGNLSLFALALALIVFARLRSTRRGGLRGRARAGVEASIVC
ncbi:MAG: hypothetical protein WBL23_13960 [Salinisphaera sp.]|uniref:PEP-CTERM sorting domain-containing protein n=1 Tax=Salinisphaera sp. TaxID=1914330 RepID=UPI003C7C30C5